MLKRLTFKKILLIGIPLLIVIIVLITPKGKKNSYVMDKVQRRDISEVVSESGNVQIKGIVEVISPSKGIIEEIYVSNGDIVGIGDELFKVRSTATEDEKATAYASYMAAQAGLKEAEQSKLNHQATLEQARKSVLDAGITLRRMNDLIIQNKNNPATGEKFTDEEIESIEAAYKSASYNYSMVEKKYVESDSAIESARAALRQAELNYESTKSRTITSPAIGTVSNLSVSVGDVVEVETLTYTPIPVLTIANFSSISIVLDVNESDISKLKIGQKATVEPDAFNKTYSAVVNRIDDIGSTSGSGGVVDYKVYLEIEEPDSMLKAGMTVDVDIVTKEEKGVLSIQNEAVKPYQGGKAVRILNGKGEIEYKGVEVGIKGRDYTQIISGINEGEEVIVSLSDAKNKKSNPFNF